MQTSPAVSEQTEVIGKTCFC